VRRRAVCAVVLGLFAGAAKADVYYLVDGDRITGKTVSLAAGEYKVQTAYGRISIPRGRVQRVVKDDGSEEVVNAPVATPPPVPAAPPVRLVVIVTGASFWQAWIPAKDQTVDPTLRFSLSIDDEPVASYADADPDPEIPGAVVNAFSFDAERTAVSARDGVKAAPPEVRPGKISLKLELPPEMAGEHVLGIAYQSNDATAAAPKWRDLVSGAIHAELRTDAPNLVRLKQDRGNMEFSGFVGKKHMKNVDSFRIEIGME
jgi:hypothetical protein